MEIGVDITDAVRKYAANSPNKLFYLVETQGVLEDVKISRFRPEIDIFSKQARDIIHTASEGEYTGVLGEDLIPLRTCSVVLAYNEDLLDLTLVQSIWETETEYIKDEHILLQGRRIGAFDIEGSEFDVSDFESFFDINNAAANSLWTLLSEDFDMFEYSIEAK